MKSGIRVYLLFMIFFVSAYGFAAADSGAGKKIITGQPAISDKDVDGYVRVVESINSKLKAAVGPAIKDLPDQQNQKDQKEDDGRISALMSAISVLKTDLKTLEAEGCKTAGVEPEKYRETQTRLSQVLAYLSLKKAIKDDGKYSPKAFKDEFSGNLEKEIEKLALSVEKAKEKKIKAQEEEKEYFERLNDKLDKEKDKKAKVEEKLSKESDPKKKENHYKQISSADKAISACEEKLKAPFPKLEKADEDLEKAQKHHDLMKENKSKIVDETVSEKKVKDHELKIEDMKKKLEEPDMKQASLDLPVFRKFGDRVTIIGAGVFNDKKPNVLSALDAD